MATFTPYVNTYERKDKKRRVHILICAGEDDKCYMDTGIYVVRGQLSKDLKSIKDKYVLSTVLDKIKECERTVIQDLGSQLSSFTSKQIKAHLEAKYNTPAFIDFVKFAREYIKELLEEGEAAKSSDDGRNKKKKRALHIQTTINAFVDKFGKEYDITRLFPETLIDFERYLRAERIISRRNQFGVDVKTKRSPLTDTGVHDYMIDIQVVFKAAIAKYNNKNRGITPIKNDPFDGYKIPKANSYSGKKRNIEVEKIRRIIEYDGKGRAKLARDCYLLSLFLVGINSVDLYEIGCDCIFDGRVSYNRSKTEGRRPDKAFISIKIEPEAEKIINEYRDSAFKKRAFRFYRNYADASGFNAAINKGLKAMAMDINKSINDEIEAANDETIISKLKGEKIPESIDYYSARHSWATIVKNNLGYSKYIIAECLNHAVDNLRSTDRYIEKEFNWIDDINRKFIDFVYGKKESPA